MILSFIIGILIGASLEAIYLNWSTNNRAGDIVKKFTKTDNKTNDSTKAKHPAIILKPEINLDTVLTDEIETKKQK